MSPITVYLKIINCVTKYYFSTLIKILLAHSTQMPCIYFVVWMLLLILKMAFFTLIFLQEKHLLPFSFSLFASVFQIFSLWKKQTNKQTFIPDGIDIV